MSRLESLQLQAGTSNRHGLHELHTLGKPNSYDLCINDPNVEAYRDLIYN